MPNPSAPRAARGESREIVELRRLKTEQPALAPAVDLQIGLLGLQRRVQARVALPWVEVDKNWLNQQQREGRPLLRFKDIPLDWTDFRLMFREATELLRRFDNIEEADAKAILRVLREGHALEPLVIRWYNSAALRGDTPPADEAPAGLPDMIDQVLLLAMRPFLTRCAEAVLPRLDLSGWTHGYCPLCGGEPEFAVINPSADRLLICSRCAGRWPYDPLACPFCGNQDRRRITSFASRDGLYRIAACDVCRRYMKAYDARHASRPVMVPLDSIATLPLDAAAMQRGYTG